MNNTELSKIALLKNTYKTLIDNYLKMSDGLKLESPHIILKEIILEIEGNGLSNSNNINYFIRKLDYYIKDDLIVVKHFSSDFKLIKQGISDKRIGYVLIICRNIEEKFASGLYFNELLNLITELIIGAEDINYNLFLEIKSLTSRLITEFILRDFAIKDYKNFIENVFSDYSVEEYGIQTDFPLKLFGFNLADRSSFEQIKEFMHQLTTIRRIDAIKKYIVIPPKNVRFLFVVLGLRGMEKFEFDGITFYNPIVDQMANSALGRLQVDSKGEYSEYVFLEAAVEVNLTLPSSALSKALTKLEKALDLIQAFIKVETPLKIDPEGYAIIDESGAIIYNAYAIASERMQLYYKSFEVDDYKDLLEKIFKPNDTGFSLYGITNSNITNALHWHRKGNDSNIDADKLLNYWISIENIFSSIQELSKEILKPQDKPYLINLVQSTIESIYFLNAIHNETWELYWHYRNKVYFERNRVIPQKIIDKAKLSPSGPVKLDLNEFIENLKEIINYEQDPVYIGKIQHVISIANNKNEQREYIKVISENIRDEVLMIYRLRNMIVHNAEYNNPLLPYYVWMSRNYSGILIRSIMDEIKNGKSVKDCLVSFRVFKDRYLANLK